MAIQLTVEERDLRRIVDAIIQLNQGRQNSVGSVTLRANQTTTTVSFKNCSTGCRVFLEPRSASARTARGMAQVTSILQGSFVITHASNAATDQTYDFVCIGG